ncbi:hypothetical protein MHLP_02465 [Candidatus Mycoplasma haematolamae str. Purdue]|uniref:Uncharacterized protein n=1 Tax=Mycoplasma haematolamae (strain Purdue) TaxID=1212765 RepID=I7BJN1_MYCHA|nr:hypothetical protein [Candidatus Mycoplasma haematolamae]AFO52073.1 hypothetical protein MHLP_02465 [Candidatus Mycoplasma haematolamae str. Purdue]
MTFFAKCFLCTAGGSLAVGGGATGGHYLREVYFSEKKVDSQSNPVQDENQDRRDSENSLSDRSPSEPINAEVSLGNSRRDQTSVEIRAVTTQVPAESKEYLLVFDKSLNSSDSQLDRLGHPAYQGQIVDKSSSQKLSSEDGDEEEEEMQEERFEVSVSLTAEKCESLKRTLEELNKKLKESTAVSRGDITAPLKQLKKTLEDNGSALKSELGDDIYKNLTDKVNEQVNKLTPRVS